VTTGSNRNLGEAFQVLHLRRHYDIHILGASHYTPRIYCQTTHDDKLHIRRSEPSQELVECRLAQLLRAAPVNRISL